jgi:hypothetical protein
MGPDGIRRRSYPRLVRARSFPANRRPGLVPGPPPFQAASGTALGGGKPEDVWPAP